MFSVLHMLSYADVQNMLQVKNSWGYRPVEVWLLLSVAGSGHGLLQAQGDYVYSADMQPNRTPQPSDEIYTDNPTSPVSPKPTAPKPTHSKPAGPKQTTPKPVPGETMSLELRDTQRANVLYNFAYTWHSMYCFNDNALSLTYFLLYWSVVTCTGRGVDLREQVLQNCCLC